MSDILQALGLEPIKPTNLTRYISVATRDATEFAARAEIVDGAAVFYGDGDVFGSIVAAIESTQAGSGEPSPDNVRPIIGHTGAVFLYRTGEETQEIPVTWETEAGTVYGGTIDIASGILTVTYIKTTPRGGTWSNANVFSIATRNANWIDRPMKTGTWQNDPQTMANCLRKGPRDSSGQVPSILFGSSNDYIYIYNQTKLPGVTDNQSMDLWMVENLEITYQLAEPLVYRLPTIAIPVINGESEISANCGPILQVTY